MKIKEIRAMDLESLKKKLEELKKELMKINAQVAMGTTPKSPGQVKNMKKTIAKILTIMKEKPAIKNAKSQDDKENKEVKKKV